jgi:hypothetical protein
VADDNQHKLITRRQALIGAGRVVVVGTAAFAVSYLGVSDGERTLAASYRAALSPTVASGHSKYPSRILQATAFCGIYYDKPTIKLTGSTNAENQFKLGLAIGATSWQVLDAHGRPVGHGTATAGDTTLTVCVNGEWAGGAATFPGHYTVVTNAGAHGVVTGNVVVCPPTKLSIPKSPLGMGAWLAVAPDRDSYSYQPGHVVDLVSTIRQDPYFTGRQDSARPRPLWIAPSGQAQFPHQGPTAKQWGELATAMKAAGHPGAYYECPTNEPENGGWSTLAVISYWKDCQKAIKAADSSAHVMGFDSAGLMSASSLSSLGQFLAACPVDAVTNHMEDSHKNLSNIVALRQYFGALKKRFAASGRPKLDLWLTETGINGGGYGVLQPRRDARQRTILRMVFESFGWPKEHSYDFRIFDAHGSGLATFMVDGQNNDETGNLRAGATALHVMSEALYGTTCTTSNPPVSLKFGRTGGTGDSLFAGLHYRGKAHDVVVLATNGMEKASVDLKVSASGDLTVWDGLGVPSTAHVTSGRVRIPLDDLLTYVFLPSESTVQVAPMWWSSLSDAAHGKKVVTGSGNASIVTAGTFAPNLQGGSVPGQMKPYITAKFPATLAVRTTKPAKGFALFTGGPAWQDAGSSIVAFEISVDGHTVYSYECASAVTLPISSPSSANSSDPCLYTTFWTGPFAWLEEVDIPAGNVELKITKASFGGQPDKLGSTAPGSRSKETDAQAVSLAAWQLLA